MGQIHPIVSRQGGDEGGLGTSPGLGDAKDQSPAIGTDTQVLAGAWSLAFGAFAPIPIAV